MKHYVIIDQLKEKISDRKVTAAVFYTFTFESRFFENYILPVFLPNVNFSDNEIQNAILWRKYGRDLPPVTVFCDFHAKGNNAPSVNYEIFPVDLPADTNGRKACFHPKVSFLNLDDGALLILTGSNNLTMDGWCKNKEIVGIKELKNGEYFPYDQKYQLWSFLKSVNGLAANEYSVAEKTLDDFFRQRLHTPEANFDFYDSAQMPFNYLLGNLLSESGEEKFEQVEIISRFISTEANILNDLTEFTHQENIFINVPYLAGDEADITEDNYYNFQKKGIKWARLTEEDSEKGFRMNHTKVYRLKTSSQVYTIVGSVNFTKAAWNGRKNNSNIEAAMIFKEPVKNWQSWLEEYHNANMVFAKEQDSEASIEVRPDVPDLEFKLDWQKQTLQYNNKKQYDFKGEIIFSKHSNVMLKKGVHIFKLDDKIIDELAQNPVIRVKQHHTQYEFRFYPIQHGIESKPIPHKLRLKDAELIQLWENISIYEKEKSEITNLIERYLMERTDKEGELIEGEAGMKSTLNMMASHISALVHLEEKIFTVPKLKREYSNAIELLNYYLFTSNIDTLIGYRDLLDQMLNQKKILPSVYWFLLNIVLKNLYDKNKIARFLGNLEGDTTGLTQKIVDFRATFEKRKKKIESELSRNDIKPGLFKWVNKNI